MTLATSSTIRRLALDRPSDTATVAKTTRVATDSTRQIVGRSLAYCNTRKLINIINKLNAGSGMQ